MPTNATPSRALALESVANLIETDPEFFRQLQGEPGKVGERSATSDELRASASKLRDLESAGPQ
ncbi:hypothetical protein [Pseudomonas aeruginosa]|uniref:hypothetical protein n=1 Tax=Pseudomonas aeruginosa TaxID=287 RepID=UPI00093C69F9|nr:hypothetical protein [Pseudomonas aeruginosa]ELD5773043.1 hypothetical protein [Pseudomonas aeruginosa]MBG4607048.1 hypothetical protein [Pseudomonas aeruginosa]MBG5536955.1 hypothetical protein [Pseudomonas aeruginosa]MBG5780367.1 hypothetical protein [Pseudomonas aeruginosa]MBT9112252.1 hypothetical protein [Pseudomonas aeruginosa]